MSEVVLNLTNLLLKLPSRALLGTLFFYQKTRFLRPPSCRFYPSCSEYMTIAVRRFGFGRGLFIGLGRLGRCHPLHEGGVDEVPHHWSRAGSWSKLWSGPTENLLQFKKNRPEVASEY